MFLFSEVRGSFRSDCSCLLKLTMSGAVCLVHYLFSGMLLIFQGHKTNFFIIVLTWSASLWLVVLNLRILARSLSFFSIPL